MYRAAMPTVCAEIPEWIESPADIDRLDMPSEVKRYMRTKVTLGLYLYLEGILCVSSVEDYPFQQKHLKVVYGDEDGDPEAMVVKRIRLLNSFISVITFRQLEIPFREDFTSFSPSSCIGRDRDFESHRDSYSDEELAWREAEAMCASIEMKLFRKYDYFYTMVEHIVSVWFSATSSTGDPMNPWHDFYLNDCNRMDKVSALYEFADCHMIRPLVIALADGVPIEDILI